MEANHTAKFNRVILIILDSLGVGALPDAEKYGDAGSNTLAHILSAYPEIKLPNLRKLGLLNIDGLEEYGVPAKLRTAHPAGAFGRLQEASAGKDTITGHWELAGLVTDTPFQTFAHFPDAFIKAFEAEIGTEVIGNYQESGTVILDKLGPEHERTGKPIVYTSSDSVFQIAANTAVIPLERLYQICEIARRLLQGELLIGRVIARPYVLLNGERVRTTDRHDYSVPPPSRTLLDSILGAGAEVTAIGKIGDIFSGKGIRTQLHTEGNQDGIEKTLAAIRSGGEGLIFTNLVDFDSQYGHRRDPVGYAHAIEQFDRYLPEILEALRDDDVLFLSADHGNDPTHSGFDHTREHIPVLIYGKRGIRPVNIGTRSSFADIGKTIAALLDIPAEIAGESFSTEINMDRFPTPR